MQLVRIWLLFLVSVSAHAAAPTQPPRWVQADDLRVRAGPGPDQKVVGVLQRGAELILKDTNEHDGYCLIEGDGQYGYVACKYLSATKVARPRAGEGGIDAATRWVTGGAVNMREAPRGDAPVLARLALNSTVKLLRENAGGGYCEVQPATGPSGFTACRYLAPAPLVLSRIRDTHLAADRPNPNYDPERVFSLQPGWVAMEQYAVYLKDRNPKLGAKGPWPRDEILERMKAHLAKGLNGPKPEAFEDWQELKRKAEQAYLKRDTDNIHVLQNAIQIWGELHESIAIKKDGASRVINLLRALEFPAVQPSLFRSEADIAPPRANAEELSGRFGIVYRQLFSPRTPAKENEEFARPGLYDMQARTSALVKPVQRVSLFRDGRLRSEPSFAKHTESLWYEVDPPMCDGWIPGFSFGDIGGAIWRYLGDDGASHKESLKRNPAGSLFMFYTANPLPRTQASRSETQIKMDRAATGFARATQMHFDLDSDGVPDLAIWEGEGKGPGHLGGQTLTDDRWYRLAMVNIAGRWKVLGADVFSYGCGC